MKTTSFLPLSKSIRWITILASIIMLGAIGMMVYEWLQLQQPQLLWVLILLVVIIGATIAMIPRKVTVTDKDINIHLLAWKINIPADEIEKIEYFPHGIDAHRIVGAGGYFGNLGLFTSKECGKHLSLITDPTNVCVITRKTKIPIAVSTADNSVFNTVAEVQERN
ncbi:MAG: hypothetical protein IKV22_02270 [Paludibacteraceae bacterium]|nr:hypothetical protein [Paludibacteraceae bacterium]